MSQNPSLRGEEKGTWGAREGTASTIESREGREERERGWRRRRGQGREGGGKKERNGESEREGWSVTKRNRGPSESRGSARIIKQI